MNMHDDRYLFDREGIYVDYCQTVEKLMKNLFKSFLLSGESNFALSN